MTQDEAKQRVIELARKQATSLIPEGWKVRHFSDKGLAYTRSIYDADGKFVGTYQNAGDFSATPWRHLGRQFATEAEAQAAVIGGRP